MFATSAAKSDGTNTDGGLAISESDATNTPLARMGITAKTYWCPILFYGNYAQQPPNGWYSNNNDSQPRPTGSIWWKTTSTGVGYSPSVKKYNSALDSFIPVAATMYTTIAEAIYNIDPVGGGANIAAGTVATFTGISDATGNALRIGQCNFDNTSNSYATATSGVVSSAFVIGNSFTVQSSIPGSASTISNTITLTGTTATSFVSDLLSENIPYVTAAVNSDNSITIIRVNTLN